MFGEGDLGSLHIQELWQKNSEIYGQYLHWSCILLIAPSVYIELPLGNLADQSLYYNKGSGEM